MSVLILEGKHHDFWWLKFSLVLKLLENVRKQWYANLLFFSLPSHSFGNHWLRVYTVIDWRFTSGTFFFFFAEGFFLTVTFNWLQSFFPPMIKSKFTFANIMHGKFPPVHLILMQIRSVKDGKSPGQHTSFSSWKKLLSCFHVKAYTGFCNSAGSCCRIQQYP